MVAFVLDLTYEYSKWKWPNIPGLRDFNGEVVHSANWPENLVHSGKRVAVIGNGSSGVQIVPALQPGKIHHYASTPILIAPADVKELVHFVRSPTWIVPPQQQALTASEAGEILQSVEMDGDKFTEAQIEKFKSSPEYYLQFVKAVEEQINSKFSLVSLNDTSIFLPRMADPKAIAPEGYPASCDGFEVPHYVHEGLPGK